MHAWYTRSVRVCHPQTLLERERVAAAHVQILSQSDHLPVLATVAVERGVSDGCSLKVASHNVQEFVMDGVHTYVCATPGIKGSKGKGACACTCDRSSS
jgi:hypothetical protein